MRLQQMHTAVRETIFFPPRGRDYYITPVYFAQDRPPSSFPPPESFSCAVFHPDPVSYTHLDVYKRQRLHMDSMKIMACLAKAMETDVDTLLQMPPASDLSKAGLESVSYTHLDVYKRQGRKRSNHR